MGERQKHTCQVWHQSLEVKQKERMQWTSNVTGDDEFEYENVLQEQGRSQSCQETATMTDLLVP